MPRRSPDFAPGRYFHVYNRGAGRARIFFGPDNYAYCVRLARRYAPSCGISLVAYCLMPNHYHFLLRQGTDVPPSDFIRLVFNAYVQALNRQRRRTGTLFEGRFRHACVDDDAYLAHLCRYIHLNPVTAGLTHRPEHWRFSDYRLWIRRPPGPSARSNAATAYRRFVMDYAAERRMRARLAVYVWD